MMHNSERYVDIAIIGAGISGAYAAWRLQREQEQGKKIALFEYSDRIGGRLFTRHLQNMEHVNAEVGGMRYIPEEHRLVQGLVDEFNLPTYPFLMGSPQDENDEIGDDSLNFAYFRGQQLRMSDLRTNKVPYNLNPSENNKTPEEIQRQVVELLVSQKNLSLEQWFKVEVFGKKLYEYGFWNLMARVLSSEAYAYLRDAGGYDTLVSNRNAVSALPIEFKSETKYQAFKHGYQHLPETLVNQFVNDGGQLFTNHRLEKICREEDQTYTLNFVRTQTQDHQTTDQQPQKFVSISAKKLILAMPRRSLELIEWDQWPKVEYRESVLKQPAFKIFLGYKHPWWRALGLYAGHSITDLPIRQTYYFGTEGEQPEGDPGNQNSLLMASYNDISTVPFWKGLADADPSGEALRTAAHVQVAQVHNQRELPQPYDHIYQDWSEDPFGGGWHGWKAGVLYHKAIQKMRKPIDTEEVYICGSAYSNMHGWVEGALQTTELMLEEYFKLQRPIWLDKGYDLGP